MTLSREKDLVDVVAMIRNVQNLWLTEGGVRVQLREDLRTSDTLALKEALKIYSRDGTIERVARALMLDPDAVLAILGRM